MQKLLISIVLTVLTTLTGCATSIDTQVKLTLGTIEGTESRGIRRFLGIPYATPSTGARRWAPPAPMAPWDGVLQTKEFGPWCAQPDFDRRDEGTVEAGKGWTIFQDVPVNKDTNEDCLSINVWAQASASKAPVMVFLHGNALGTSFPVYDGTAFARDGIVFVSPNFRLHTMGNFAHPSLTKSVRDDEPLIRYTEMDQLAALQWVQDNITAFGGDPENVTLVGSSNGGAGILQMLSNKSAEGLFHKAIVQSGNGWWRPFSLSELEQLGCLLSSRAGLDGCNATVEELRALPWWELPVSGPYGIDGRGSTIGATQALARDLVIDVPLMIGWNDFDGSSLRYTAAEVIESTPQEVLSTYDSVNRSDEDLAYDIYTDLHSGAPARWVAHQLEDGQPTYLYLFSYVLSPYKDEIRGAEHAYELPHVFDSWHKALPPVVGSFFINDDDREVTRIVHGCWVSFIKSSVPVCPDAPEWPTYTREKDQLMELTLQPKVLTGFRAKQLNAHEQKLDHFMEEAKRSVEDLLLIRSP